MRILSKKGTATRQTILESARRVFIQSGYNAGVREIAKNAGVTAMLINRYFGSKEQLFEEVVEAMLSSPGILTQEIMKEAPDMPTLCRCIATALVERTEPHITPMDGFLIMLRSTNNEQATAILRKKFETHFAKPLANLLPGTEAPQRASMFLSVIAGFQVLRQIVEMEALTEAKPEYLARELELLFAVLASEKRR
jgi:AcrR family transcriptional regulator